jgi:hypothetical protein
MRARLPLQSRQERELGFLQRTGSTKQVQWPRIVGFFYPTPAHHFRLSLVTATSLSLSINPLLFLCYCCCHLLVLVSLVGVVCVCVCVRLLPSIEMERWDRQSSSGGKYQSRYKQNNYSHHNNSSSSSSTSTSSSSSSSEPLPEWADDSKQEEWSWPAGLIERTGAPNSCVYTKQQFLDLYRHDYPVPEDFDRLAEVFASVAKLPVNLDQEALRDHEDVCVTASLHHRSCHC